MVDSVLLPGPGKRVRVLNEIAVHVPPLISESGTLNRHETIHISVIVDRPVCWSDAGVEVADEQKGIAAPGQSNLNESAKKRFHPGSRADRHMDDADVEFVRRDRDFEPQAGIVQGWNPRRPGADRCLRDHADGVVEAVACSANLMREASQPESLQQRFGGGRNEFDQRHDVWVVGDDGGGNTFTASATALLDVPDEKFHGRSSGQRRFTKPV